jgi:hypothetical protein
VISGPVEPDQNRLFHDLLMPLGRTVLPVSTH